MCLQIRFHKRMGADWTNRNPPPNRFSQLASNTSHSVPVSATALVEAQWGMVRLPGDLALPQGGSPHRAGAACRRQPRTGPSRLPRSFWSPGTLRLFLRRRDVTAPSDCRAGMAACGPLARSHSPQVTAIPKSFLRMLALCPETRPC